MIWDLPSGNLLQFATLEIAIEIVDLPIINMVMFHSYVSLPEGIKKYLREKGSANKYHIEDIILYHIRHLPHHLCLDAASTIFKVSMFRGHQHPHGCLKASKAHPLCLVKNQAKHRDGAIG